MLGALYVTKNRLQSVGFLLAADVLQPSSRQMLYNSTRYHMKQIQIITLFPEMFHGVLNASMLWKAQDRGIVAFSYINLREFGLGPRKQVDDTPYGGGDGMLLKPEPLVAAIERAKQNDPGAPKKKADGGASATDTYASAYSGWEIVENAAIALTDGVDLILTPGRLCQNGKPVPGRNADFQKFAENMRKAGLAVLQAAHTKNQEKVSDATNDLADACSACHEVYRDKGPADSPARCSAPAK